MIKIIFSVRSGQGEPSGFDLGDIICEGENGTARSSGHTPDQGMMIYLSVTLLLDSLRLLFSGEERRASFTGADTSFRLDFRRDKRGIIWVSTRDELLGKSSLDELAHAVLRPALELADGYTSDPSVRDSVRSDYISAVQDFGATIL
ncbi:hypothetical protein [Streptomyces sp. NPDC048462]|uniref:hypothetical protein n=1 Tax=Streptomyces sp. NPDC048462 TaxID=3365555 RepID=UPI003710460C